MSLSSSRIPCASISKKTAGDGPLRSGWQMKVSISPSFVVMSRVFSIKRFLSFADLKVEHADALALLVSSGKAGLIRCVASERTDCPLDPRPDLTHHQLH